MPDLTDFLLARIAEDERVARWAKSHEDSGHWDIEEDSDGRPSIRTAGMGWETKTTGAMYMCDDDLDDCQNYVLMDSSEADHIARHDPARVLAECEAKRRIVERCLEDTDTDPEWLNVGVSPEHLLGADVLKLLALPYADDPRYREEWKP